MRPGLFGSVFVQVTRDVPGLQHTAHGGDGGAHGGACISSSGSTAVGGGISEARALLLDRYADCLKRVAGIAMREVQCATAGASTSTSAAGRSGGVLFVHRFGATLNATCICICACWTGWWRRGGRG